MITDEKLSAFISGDLGADEREEIHRMIDTDDTIAKRVSAFKLADDAVAAAYRGFVDEPVSKKVLALLKERKNGVSSAKALAERSRAILPGLFQQWVGPITALVALAVGFAAIFFSFANTANEPAMLVAGAIKKDNPLHYVLETTPSANTVQISESGAASITPVLTFRSQSGQYCREFIFVEHQRGYRGAACRENDVWTVRIIVTTGPAADRNALRTAAGPTDQTFNHAMRGLIEGSPLTAKEETDLLNSNWPAGDTERQ